MASFSSGRLLICCIFVIAALALHAPASAQTLRILATDPGARNTLATGDALYVHVRYEASVPVRFRVHAYRDGGRQTAGLRTNASPVHPAGQGEAMAWLEFVQPAAIDTLEVSMLDESWQPIERIEVSFPLEWRSDGRAGRRERPDWVARLSAAERQIMAAATRATAASSNVFSAVLFGLLLFFAAWSIPGYFVLQIIVYRRWRDGWRKAGLAPLLVTVPILLQAILALLAKSNLWPLMMLFTYPLAFLYLLLLAVARRFSS